MRSSEKWTILACHLNNQTWQTEWKTAPLAKVQLCEYENQTLEAFVAASSSYAKFDCPVARQNFSLVATAHDRETGLLRVYSGGWDLRQ